jgi:hypothetical protein
MNKKLMLLATGALIALAFAALPAVSSAGEYTLDCELGVGKTCTGTFAGGARTVSNANNETVTCTALTGTATAKGGTSTGTVELDFTGCRETITIFKFACNSAGKPAGTVATGNLVTHLVNLAESPGSTPGVSVTNANVTFECTGFLNKTVTGSILLHIEKPNCGTYQASHSATSTETSHGQQKFKQVTGTGPILDLISSNHNGTYITSSQVGLVTITWNAGQKVNITC